MSTGVRDLLPEIHKEVYTKLSKIGCRCSCYRANWKELSKDNWWSGFEYIIRRWGGFSDDLRSVNTVKKRMAVLRRALKQMELSHKMLKKEEVKQLKKTPSIRLLGAMLDRLEGKYPGCFNVSYKWATLSFFPSRLLPKKRKAEQPAVGAHPKRVKHDEIMVDVPVSNYTFDLNDPNPFARKKVNPFRKSKEFEVMSQDEDASLSPLEKSTPSEKSKHDAAAGPVKTVVQIPASPFRRTQNFEPAPKSPLLSLEDSNTGIESEPEKTPEDIVVQQPKKLFLPKKTVAEPKQNTLQSIQQPKIYLPKETIPAIKQNTLRSNFEPKNYMTGLLNQNFGEEEKFQPKMKKPERQLPQFERVDSLFIDEKLKEWKKIAQRTDLRPSEKKVLLEKNRKAREEYVKSEKIRFEKECRARQIQCKWDDLLDPEYNFKWMKFVSSTET